MSPADALPAPSGGPPPVASLASVPLRRTNPPARPLPQGMAAVATEPAVPAGDAPRAVIAWWERLKRGRPLPSVADIDQAAIAAAWPEAVLLVYDAAQSSITRATRLGPDAIVRGSLVDYSPMLTEWLLEAARRAAQLRAPLQEERSFPAGRGFTRYRIDALPLGESGVDHILCRLGIV